MADLLTKMTVNKIPTTQTAPVKAPVQPKTSQSEEKSESNMTKKILLGAAAAAAIAVAGIYIVKSRKKPSSLTHQKPASSVNPEPIPPKTPAAPETPVVEQIKTAEHTKQTIEEFKQTGKFIKGKAVMNNGEIFTGQLTNERKDGSKFLLEYKDGLVRSVKKLNGEEQVFEKTFSYNQNGQIRTISKNGKETAEFLYDEQGRKFVFRRFEDNMHYFFNKEGKLDHAIDMKKMNYYKDKNGTDHNYQFFHNKETQYQQFHADNTTETTYATGQRYMDKSWAEQHPELAEKYKQKYHWLKREEIESTSAFTTGSSYAYNNYSANRNFDIEYRIRKIIDVDKNMNRSKYYCIEHLPEDIKIKRINHNNKKILELCEDRSGEKVLGKYNIETKEFTDLNGITAEEAKTQLDKIFEAAKLIKEKVLELYKLQRKENLYWGKLKEVRGLDINKTMP